MCCFSKSVRFVGATKIFARLLGDGTQALVYAMSVEIDSELAMVLPIPVAHGTGDEAVRFVDLSGYPAFFDDVSRAFPPMMQPASRGAMGFGPPAAKATLVVHDVGDFEASFVPTRVDFDRLDERFRLPEGVWPRLERYADHGFAVFKLKPKKSPIGRSERQTIHPMAFVFPTRDESSLFFPTVHIHDGTIHAKANFDHALYAQDDGLLGAVLGWTRSQGPLFAYVDVPRSKGLVEGTQGGFMQALHGTLDNDDVVLRVPPGLTREDLETRGETFLFRPKATFAHLHGAADERSRTWRQNAMRIAPIARSISAELRAFEARERARYRLVPLDASLPAHFVNGRQLWTGHSYLDGTPGHRGGPGYVVFRPYAEGLEAQEVILAFAEVPDETALASLLTNLNAIVERAIASR